MHKPSNTTDLTVIGILLLVTGSLALRTIGGLCTWLTTRQWAQAPWYSGLAAVTNPAHPATAFGRPDEPFGPLMFWTLTAVTVAVPVGIGLAISRTQYHRRAGTRGRARDLASRPGLATRADVEHAVGRAQVLRRGRSARPALTRPAPQDVGTLRGYSRGRECWASVEDSQIDVGPPRSGKGLHSVINAILDAPGAMVTTSTRPDNLAATLTLRRAKGPVAVFDPQNLGTVDGIRWSPVRGCENPTTAIVRAAGLAAGAGFAKGGVSDGAFWHGQTEMALRGLLHAAAIDNAGVDRLYRWSADAGRRRRDSTVGLPVLSVRRRQPTTLDALPPYIHEAVLRVYIATANYRGLTEDDLRALLEPWTGDTGQSAFYRQIVQYDERFLVDNE